MGDILDILDEIEDYEEDIDDDSFDDDVIVIEDNMSLEEAQQITNAIKSSVTATYILIAEAHARKAHKALGYDTWAEYVKEEFDISSSRSYQLLDLSKTVKEIEAATPDGTVIKLTEAQARDIKRELPRITEVIREQTEDLEPEEASTKVNDIIEDIREQQKEDQKVVEQKEKALSEAESEGYSKGLEDAATALLEADSAESINDNADGEFIEMEVEGENDSLNPKTAMDLYNFFNMLTSITSLPDPEDIVENVPEDRYEEVNNQLEESIIWLNRFQTLWEFKDD